MSLILIKLVWAGNLGLNGEPRRLKARATTALAKDSSMFPSWGGTLCGLDTRWTRQFKSHTSLPVCDTLCFDWHTQDSTGDPRKTKGINCCMQVLCWGCDRFVASPDWPHMDKSSGVGLLLLLPPISVSRHSYCSSPNTYFGERNTPRGAHSPRELHWLKDSPSRDAKSGKPHLSSSTSM